MTFEIPQQPGAPRPIKIPEQPIVPGTPGTDPKIPRRTPPPKPKYVPPPPKPKTTPPPVRG